MYNKSTSYGRYPMDELLKKLLSAEVLTEETKQELEQAFATQLQEAIEGAREEAVASVTAELNEQWITERETLIEAIDEQVSSVLKEQMDELKEDIERFRDLEAEYAVRIVEAKEEMAEQLKSDIDVLIEKLDKFLEIRLSAEIEELREDVQAVRKNEFGKTVFEAFVAEFKKHYTADDSLEGRLAETNQRLEDALTALEESEMQIAKMERATKMREVLTPLSGRQREVMEAILKNVDTPMLEEAYGVYVNKVVKETSDKKDVKEELSASEKETKKVLAEGEKKDGIKGVKVSGDNTEVLNENEKLDEEQHVKSSISDDEKARVRRLAGLA